MNTLAHQSSVGRRGFLGLIGFTLVPAALFAENAGTGDGGSVTLTPEQFDRMYKRLMGKWRLVPDKSTFFVGSAPKNPNSFIYTPAPDQALGFANENGASAAKFDGKLYDASPTIPGTMLARILHDEFTVENVLSRNGKVTARNLQYYAPNGAFAIY